MSTIEINIKVVERTLFAWLVSDGQKDVWIPISCIEDYAEEDDGMLGTNVTSIVIPTWLADDKGLTQLVKDVNTLDLFGGTP